MFAVNWVADVNAHIREGTNILWAACRGACYKNLALWLVPVQTCIRKFNNCHNNRCNEHVYSATNARSVCARSGVELNFRAFLAHVCIQMLVSHKTMIKYHASTLGKTLCFPTTFIFSKCVQWSGALRQIKYSTHGASYKQPFIASFEGTSTLLVYNFNLRATFITRRSGYLIQLVTFY